MPIGAALAALTAVSKVSGAIGVGKNLLSKATGEGGAEGAGGGGLLSSLSGGGGNAVLGGVGLAKNIAGRVQQKKADAMLPQHEDPEQRALASYATRRKRAFQTGTAQAGQRQALRENLKTGIGASFRVGGGAKGLNMMTRMFNQAQLGLSNQALAGETKFAEMESAQKNTIAQRKLELGLLKYSTEQARAAQNLKEGKSMTNLALARSVGIEEPNPYGTGGQQVSTTGSKTGTQTITGVGNE